MNSNRERPLIPCIPGREPMYWQAMLRAERNELTAIERAEADRRKYTNPDFGWADMSREAEVALRAEGRFDAADAMRDALDADVRWHAKMRRSQRGREVVALVAHLVVPCLRMYSFSCVTTEWSANA